MAQFNIICGCCGAAAIELYGEAPLQVVKACVANYHNGITYYVFIDAARTEKPPKAGAKLAAFIKKNKIGTVINSPKWYMNLCHGPNKLMIYVWIVDKKGLDKWMKGHKGVNFVGEAYYDGDDLEEDY